MTGKRILAVHRYFYPDTAPYATILKSIVEKWIGQGHQVEVLSSKPSYGTLLNDNLKGDISGYTVTRLNLKAERKKPLTRLLNAIKLCAALSKKVLFSKKYDVVMISTVPPVIGAWVAAVCCKLRGTRFIYHVMDVHPEIGAISGEFKKPIVFKLLSAMDSFSCRVATPVVVLSNDMKASIEKRGVDGVEVIPNFEIGVAANESSLPYKPKKESVSVLFAGNMGRFQGLDKLILGLAECETDVKKHIELIFMGEGTEKEKLISIASEKELDESVTFLEPQPIEVAKRMMQASDFGFVSLVGDIYRYAYPSKVSTYLAQGLPVWAHVEANSELARNIQRNGIGVVSDSRREESLQEGFKKLLSLASDSEISRDSVREYSEKELSKSKILAGWAELIDKD
ncbi:glycosyltransferase family 4 protein [Idiomarina sp. ST20R2A10]|uniref:glycosyltransferase family 4 protein n=1 Tax=Idiomarina sp. ST20R2A10 TaxID=3418369 RepID=UPI003EC93E73